MLLGRGGGVHRYRLRSDGSTRHGYRANGGPGLAHIKGRFFPMMCFIQVVTPFGEELVRVVLWIASSFEYDAKRCVVSVCEVFRFMSACCVSSYLGKNR